MAETKLRRNLGAAFDPGEDFPPATLLTQTVAMLDARSGSGYRRSHPLAIAAMIGVLLLAALGVFQLHLWTLTVHPSAPARSGQPGPTAPAPSGQLAPSVSRGGPWGFGGLAMVTPTTGWDNGVPFMRTIDGGAHWANVTPQGVGRSFDDYYLDATHAWVTDYSGVEPTQIVTFRTADGGSTWQRGAPIAIQAGLGQTQQYYVDSQNGWLLVSTANHAATPTMFSDSLYRTEDGGLHWRLIAVNSAPASWRPPKFYCYQWCQMAFVSPTTGWIIGSQNQPTFLITHDGGTTWRTWAPLRSAALTCHCLAGLPTFLDQNHGWILLASQAPASRAEQLLVTSDGGSTWTPRGLPSAAPLVVGFYGVDHGWAIADAALSLYRTNDGGHTWTRVRTNLQVKDGQVNGLYFLDDATGFAFRTPTGAQLWELLRTTDSGRTWMVIGRNL